MGRDLCLAPRAQSSEVDAGTARDDEVSRIGRTKEILYIDQQHLTRDCVGEQLAMYFPDVLIEAVATARSLSKDDADAHRFMLCILNKHAMRLGEVELSDQLSFLAETAPDLALVILSDFDDADEVAKAFGMGVRGLIPTNLPIKQAIEAIRLVSAGGSFIPPSVLRLSAHRVQVQGCANVEDRPCVERFTPRQMEVLQRLWQGKQNKSIAYDLKVCESTVKVHIRHLMKKLKARNRTQIVVLTRSLSQNGRTFVNS
jgi:DNA-binding NarL/FixJ family response regulator